MINDLDSTLERIIYTVGKISRNDVDVSFEQPNREWAARVSRPTLNLWAYDIRENLRLRPNPNQVRNTTARTAEVFQPPVRFDVSYWVSAWARKVEDEHNLLWRGLAALKKTRVIQPRTAEGSLRESTIDIPVRVAEPSEQAVNISDLWGVLDNSMKLGFLMVTTIEMDLDLAVETPLVLDRTLRVGERAKDGSQQLSVLDVEITKKGDRNGRDIAQE